MKDLLKDYFELIEFNKLNSIKSTFYDEELFFYECNSKTTDTELKWLPKENCYNINHPFMGEYKLNFNGYLGGIVKQHTKNFKLGFRDTIINMLEKEVRDYSKRNINEIKHLVQVSENINTEGIEVIRSSMHDLLSFLAIYCNNHENQIMNINKNKKLRWLGKINTLVTLFFDLSQDTNNLKTRFIAYNRQELTDFIVNNFTDSEGKDIEASTVYRILDANPYDFKKAKKRIEIDGQ